jgi:hypothetical protein
MGRGRQAALAATSGAQRDRYREAYASEHARLHAAAIKRGASPDMAELVAHVGAEKQARQSSGIDSAELKDEIVY